MKPAPLVNKTVENVHPLHLHAEMVPATHPQKHAQPVYKTARFTQIKSAAVEQFIQEIVVQARTALRTINVLTTSVKKFLKEHNSIMSPKMAEEETEATVPNQTHGL